MIFIIVLKQVQNVCVLKKITKSKNPIYFNYFSSATFCLVINHFVAFFVFLCKCIIITLSAMISLNILQKACNDTTADGHILFFFVVVYNHHRIIFKQPAIHPSIRVTIVKCVFFSTKYFCKYLPKAIVTYLNGLTTPSSLKTNRERHIYSPGMGSTFVAPSSWKLHIFVIFRDMEIFALGISAFVI